MTIAYFQPTFVSSGSHRAAALALALVLGTCGFAEAKLPELDAVYWGAVSHNSSQPLVALFPGHILVIGRLNGTVVAQAPVAVGQSRFVLKVPLDDGLEPRLASTARFGEQIRIYLRNSTSGAEYEATQTKTVPLAISPIKGDVILQNFSITQDLSTASGGLAAYEGWRQGFAGYAPGTDDSQVDLDGDGRTNREEFLADTDPTSNESALRIIELARSNGVNAVKFGPVRLGRVYSVYSSDTLESSDWRKVGAVTPNNNTLHQWFDHVSNQQNVFYRVEVTTQ